MRLWQLALQGFQSYAEEQVIDIDEHVTLLAGRNNVGKSALLRALQAPFARQEGATARFRLTYTWEVSSVDLSSVQRGMALEWLLEAGDPKSVRAVFTGRIGADGELGPDQLTVASLEILGYARSNAGGGWDIQVQTEASGAALRILTELVKQWAEQTLYLAPRRIETGIRQLSHATELMPDARNLSDVLLNLELSERFGMFEEVESVMRSAFPGLRGLSVAARNQTGGAQLQGEPHVYFEGSPESVPLRLCGTGLEQMLAMAVGVLTAKQPRLVLIDEPQAYLHPHAERSMLSLFASHPEHQYIIATHSHTLLASQPLRRTRLLSLQGGRTRVAQVADEQDALEALEVSAADLWLVDRLIWVEGPTEERVFELVATHVLPESERSTLGIHRMPDASQFASKTSKKAEATFRFCAEVARAIAPIAVEMRFVFDSDEKSSDFVQRLNEVSNNRTIFLPVREIENLFLVPALIHECIAQTCAEANIQEPTPESVSKMFGELLAAVDDKRLYPAGPPDTSKNVTVVKGSRLLQELWWEFVGSDYRKVEDGERLARLSLARGSDELRPLEELLRGRQRA
jgi:hypothetical protein